MGDWKKRLLVAVGYAAYGALSLLLLYTVVQGWAQKLDSRYLTTLGFLLIAGLSALLWKKISLATRVHLLAVYLIVLIGGCALYYSPQSKTSFMIGPFSLSFLVNLLIFLSLSLSLFLLLRGIKVAKGVKIGIGVFGALCSIPFLIGLIRDIPLGEVLQGEGFVRFLPRFLQPSFLGVVLLLPVLLIFLLIDFFRAARSERRSTLSGGLNLLAAAVPFAVGVAGMVAQAQTGIVTRYFSDHNYRSLKKEEVGKSLDLSWKAPPVPSSAGDRFWVEWEGVIQVPKGGEYEFRTQGEGQGFLFIDGQRVFGDDERSGKIQLTAGRHSFRAAAIEDKKEGKFLVQWKPPDAKDFDAIPAKQLGHQDDQTRWKRTPRQAAQLGLEWLQSASREWQESHQCFGCHVQGQVLMGLSVAQKNDYRVHPETFKALFDFTRDKQNEDGTYHNTFNLTATQFAAMGMAYAQDYQPSWKNPKFFKAVDWLLKQQKPEGFFEIDHDEAPIDQGSIMTTANAAFALMQAFKETGKDEYKQASDRALVWIAAAPAESTQDKIFKILALAQFGAPAQRPVVGQLVEQLKREQSFDGGWKETATLEGSNGFATGQVLYAFKKAGVSINSPEFSKGVLFLLDHQKISGAWPAEHTQTGRPSEFAPTMWAVIGLAGSFGEIIPEILEPADKSSVSGDLVLKAQVTNFTDSEIKSVAFDLDGKSLGTAQPQDKFFALPWKAEGLPEGEHKLRVVATNQAGKQGEATITVYSGLGVQVKLLQPQAGAVVTAKLPVQAEAKGLYGQKIQKVEFFAGPAAGSMPGSKLGETGENAGNDRYGMDWDPSGLPDGPYRVTAIATNSRGQQAQDSVVVSKQAPLSVKITSPASGQEVAGVSPCVATVVNQSGAPMSYVEFFLDGEISLGRSPADKFEVPCNFAGAAPGAHTLKAVATTAQGLSAADSIPIVVGDPKGPGYLKVQLKNLDEPSGEQVLYFPPENIELVLDMSGSMWEQIQGKSKIEIAREVLASLVKSFPKDANLSVRVYGHRSKSECTDSELLVPPGKVDAAQVTAKINALKPKGMTLIDYSLREALKDVQALGGSKAVILVTDGIETCKGDPVKAAQDLMAAGLKMKIHVVGFDLSRAPDAVEQLKKVAEAGQGKFFMAENAQDLGQALTEAVKVGYSVYDDQNRLVFSKPLGLESNELMSGTYRVEVALDPPLVLAGVKIEKGKTSVVDVFKKDKAFRIESPQAQPKTPESVPAPSPGSPPAPESRPAAPAIPPAAPESKSAPPSLPVPAATALPGK